MNSKTIKTKKATRYNQILIVSIIALSILVSVFCFWTASTAYRAVAEAFYTETTTLTYTPTPTITPTTTITSTPSNTPTASKTVPPTSTPTLSPTATKKPTSTYTPAPLAGQCNQSSINTFPIIITNNTNEYVTMWLSWNGEEILQYVCQVGLGTTTLFVEKHHYTELLIRCSSDPYKLLSYGSLNFSQMYRREISVSANTCN